MKRITLLTTLMGALFAACQACPTAAAAEPQTVRDAMWIWGHYEGSYNGAWGLPGDSPITPVEGARSMGLPNVIMIRYNGKPAPPFDEYALPFRKLKKVMWSVTGAGGVTSKEERDAVFALAAKMPNITGVFMDDFLHYRVQDNPQQPPAGEAVENDQPLKPVPAALSVEQLQQLRKRLSINGRRLDLGVVVYTHQLDRRIIPHLKLCDIVSLWTWRAAELGNLENNFARLETLVPGKRVLLGLYMWDFGANKPMPVDLMTKQCGLALKWLRQGRIEGMIFLATNICDLDLETVNWTRRWIAEVGDQPLRCQTVASDLEKEATHAGRKQEACASVLRVACGRLSGDRGRCDSRFRGPPFSAGYSPWPRWCAPVLQAVHSRFLQ